MLAYYGALFISYTWKLADLLLNAMALTYILDIDELLFHSSTPQRVQRFVKQIQPLQLAPRRKFLHGIDLRAVVFLLLSGAGVVLVYFSCIRPMRENMQSALHYLCGANRDFVYVREPATGMLLWAKSTPYGSNNTVDQHSLLARTIKQLAGLSWHGGWALGRQWPYVPDGERTFARG
eukprot:gene6370-17975_t